MDNDFDDVLTPAPVLTPLPANQIQAPVMDFPDAIREIMKGKKVTRLSWDTNESYALMKDSWLTIFIRGEFHTWSVNDGDMDGKDWVVLK